MISNKKNQQMPNAGMGQSAFRKRGQSGGADQAPGGNLGKGFGTMKSGNSGKQAKYGNKPDANGVGTSSTKGVRFDAAIHRSGGQQN